MTSSNYLITEERIRAHKKHGKNSMEGKTDPAIWLPIIGEEFGEICKALTYDNQDDDNLITELVQTAAMCAAVIDAKLGNDDILHMCKD